MKRASRRFDWMWIGLPALAGGVLFLLVGRNGAAPAEGGPVFYPVILLYNYASIQVAILILLAASLLLMLWIPQALRRLPRYAWNGAALALALLGATLGCWGSLPRALGVDNYVHIDRAEWPDRVYQLGARLGLDGDNYYVLCECSRPGVLCVCGHLREAGAPVFDVRPDLVADAAAGTLAIRVGEQTVWLVQP